MPHLSKNGQQEKHLSRAILYLPIVTLVAFENVVIETELSLQGMDLNIGKTSVQVHKRAGVERWVGTCG